jgi:hypothetical protein
MLGVLATSLSHFLGRKGPRLQRDNLAFFALLDLHRSAAVWASVRFSHKLDTRQGLTFFEGGAPDLSGRPTGVCRMPA